MAYDVISRSKIDEFIRKYVKLKTKLDQDKNDKQVEKDGDVNLRMYGGMAQRDLVGSMEKVEDHLDDHAKKTDKWHSTASAYLKNAKTLTAMAKHKAGTPEGHLDLAHLRGYIDQFKRLQAEYLEDARDFEASWAALRTFNPPDVLPAEYTQEFRAARTQLKNDQRVVMVKGNAISAMYKEAQALMAIAKKAEMKGRMKDGRAQRPLADAQAAAAKVATEMAADLKDFHQPANRTPGPGTVTRSAQYLKEFGQDKTFATSRDNLVKARKAWTQADLAYKTIVAKAASMEKVLTSQTKGFRSNELSDPKIKTELAEAARDAKAAKAEVKKQTPAHAAAKKLWNELDAKFKKAGIR